MLLFQETTKIIVTSIGILVTAFLLLGGIIVAFVVDFRKKQVRNIRETLRMQQAFQQQLLQSQIETQEATFDALGKELHDNVCQLLNSARMLIGVSQRTAPAESNTLELAGNTISTAINEIRGLAKTLNKEWLQQFNLYENLAMEIKRINAGGNLEVRLQHDAVIPFDADKQLLLFRIVQEAVQNAVKHAAARHIDIAMHCSGEQLEVQVADDGGGITDAQNQKGLGMMNMQQRVQLLGGQIEWRGNDKGTTVFIHLPINPIT